MAEKSIELDSVEIAAAIFGNCDRNIRLLEKEFSVTAVCRGTMLRLSGEEANVAAAVRAVEGMLLLIENHTPLEDQTVRYCLSLAHDGKEQRVRELTEDFVTVTVKGLEDVYVIEVKNTVDGVATEIDLYYSKDGVLVKKLVDMDEDYDYSDYIPVAPAAGVDAFLKANFPNARILDIDREDNMTEVEILDGKVVRELLFDGTGNWLFTKTEMSYAALPAVVKQALDASEYAGYRVDDVDHYVTSAEEYYRLELESVMGDVKVKITATGELSPMEQNPAGPGNNAGGILTDKIKEFITQKYAGARIIESDMEKGMTEVEIFHEGREKDVYFNGAQDWVRTEWGVRVNELPAAVLDVIRKTYADYRIDDADYVETRTESYYLVELERGENEVDLRILPNGTIL